VEARQLGERKAWKVGEPGGRKAQKTGQLHGRLESQDNSRRERHGDRIALRQDSLIAGEPGGRTTWRQDILEAEEPGQHGMQKSMDVEAGQLGGRQHVAKTTWRQWSGYE